MSPLPEPYLGDPGDEQPTLFNPATTIAPVCTARDCQAGTRKNLCRHDAELEHGWPPGKRPRSCLQNHDPKDGVIPF